MRPPVLAHRLNRRRQRRTAPSRQAWGRHRIVHAHRLRSPLTGAEGVRQFQFAPLPDGLAINRHRQQEDRTRSAGHADGCRRATFKHSGQGGRRRSSSFVAFTALNVRGGSHDREQSARIAGRLSAIGANRRHWAVGPTTISAVYTGKRRRTPRRLEKDCAGSDNRDDSPGRSDTSPKVPAAAAHARHAARRGPWARRQDRYRPMQRLSPERCCSK